MNFGNQPESQNYTDDTNPSGLHAIRNFVGNWLYQHGVTKNAGGGYYNPNVQPGPFGQPNTPAVPIGPDGRRSDIDWGSNASIPGAPQGLMSQAAAHQQAQNDALAQYRGFKNAQQMMDFYQRQQERTGQNGDGSSANETVMQKLFSIHPSVMLQHVLDKWNQATGGQQQ